MTTTDPVATAKILLEMEPVNFATHGARELALICARHILTEPSRDAVEAARDVARAKQNDKYAWAVPGGFALDRKWLEKAIAAAITAGEARAREECCKVVCGLCEDGLPVFERPSFITQGTTWVHDINGRRHRCNAAAIRAGGGR